MIMYRDLLNPFDAYTIPFAAWAQALVDWLTSTFRPAFQAARWPVAHILDAFQYGLTAIPQAIFLIVLFLLAWRLIGLRTGLLCTLCMAFLGLIGVWPDTMTTLALIITAVLFSLALGIPLGIIAGRSDRAEAFFRPILDVMQTLPAFVYLVPIVMLVGIGNVPGVLITIFYALPPIIRLTSLGIRGVPESLVEAAMAFGSSRRQVLWKVQLPLAIPSIRVGVNQTLMMALGMVTFASMIAVQGLGLLVLRGIGRLDMGLAAQGGVGIVVLAIVLDQLTQSLVISSRRPRSAGQRLIGPFSRPRAALGRAKRKVALPGREAA
jgi:glycine betaine/proline transport system permease protein